MPIRALPQVPGTPYRALDYGARVGLFEGGLHEVRWGYERGWLRSQVRRAVLRRRWFQVLVTTPTHVLTCWIRDEGTTGTARLFVADLAGKKVIERRAATGRPLQTLCVGPFSAEGTGAFLRDGSTTVELSRPAGDTAWRLKLDWAGLQGELRLDTAGEAPGGTTIGESGHRRPALTSRWGALAVSGELGLNGNPLPLDGAVGSLDYTNGFYARTARWLAASGCGRLPDGRSIGFAFADGDRNADQHEAMVWCGGQVHGTGRVRLLVGGDVTRDVWRFRSGPGDCELKFRPHASDVDAVSRLVGSMKVTRVAGTFSGRVPTPEGSVTIGGIPGVAEDHRPA